MAQLFSTIKSGANLHGGENGLPPPAPRLLTNIHGQNPLTTPGASVPPLPSTITPDEYTPLPPITYDTPGTAQEKLTAIQSRQVSKEDEIKIRTAAVHAQQKRERKEEKERVVIPKEEPSNVSQQLEGKEPEKTEWKSRYTTHSDPSKPPVQQKKRWKSMFKKSTPESKLAKTQAKFAKQQTLLEQKETADVARKKAEEEAAAQRVIALTEKKTKMEEIHADIEKANKELGKVLEEERELAKRQSELVIKRKGLRDTVKELTNIKYKEPSKFSKLNLFKRGGNSIAAFMILITRYWYIIAVVLIILYLCYLKQRKSQYTKIQEKNYYPNIDPFHFNNYVHR